MNIMGIFALMAVVIAALWVYFRFLAAKVG